MPSLHWRRTSAGCVHVTRTLRIFLQILAYGAFIAILGYFASMPSYRYADPGLASIKLSLSHATNRAKPCVPLTQEQIAELAANMRRTQSCERERLPLILELDIDERPALRLSAKPSGIWDDGPASIYERIPVPSGSHKIAVRLRESARTSGWDYASTITAELHPGRYFTITFRPENGGFVFR